MSKKGSVLMITLWILAILVLFALGLGWRASINLRLARYQRDRLKALYLAKAGINAIILEKQNDTSITTDTFNESWSNKRTSDDNPVFKDFSLGDGIFTISYAYKESKSDNETVLYGMMDEQGKFNINKITDTQRLSQFKELLKLILPTEKQTEVENLANALADWIDSDSNSRFSGGSESNDYTDMGYSPKDEILSTIQELLLVKGFDQEIIYGKDKNDDGIIDSTEEGIISYITIYSDGKININTTTEEILQALINADPANTDPQGQVKYKNLAEEIFDNIKNEQGNSVGRDGGDNNFGNDNDVPVDDISDITGLFDQDPGKVAIINSLNSNQYLTFSSNVFRIKSTGMVNNIKKEIEGVVEFSSNIPTFLSWHEN